MSNKRNVCCLNPWTDFHLTLVYYVGTSCQKYWISGIILQGNKEQVLYNLPYRVSVLVKTKIFHPKLERVRVTETKRTYQLILYPWCA